MKKLAIVLSVFMMVSAKPKPSQAFFGGDAAIMVPYLLKLIGQAVKQYQQMKTLYQNAKQHKDMIKSINSGLSEAIGLLENFPIEDENILGELKTFKRAINEVERLYGEIPKGKEELLLRLHDETVAESIKISNSLKKYAEMQERNSNRIVQRAAHVSPKGAAKVNLQTNAAILHTLNQLLKVNGQILKLQSESLAYTNKGAKEENYHFKKVTEDLGRSFQGFEADFRTPKL